MSKENENNIIIVDGNSIGHTAQHYQRRTFRGMDIQAISGFLEVITDVYNRHHEEYPKIIVLWDGKSKHRYEAFPDYKGTRRITPEQIDADFKYKEQIPHIEKMLNSLGIRQYKADDYEADDVAGFFVRKGSKDGRKILLLSNDHDWLQYINENTAVFSPKGGNMVIRDHNNFHEYVNLTARQFIEYKAFLGDSGDNIPGVDGIGDKIATALLQEFHTTENLLKMHKEDTSSAIILNNVILKRARNKIATFCEDSSLQQKFIRNVDLMDLLNDRFDNDMGKNIKYTSPKIDKQEFVEFCADFNFGYHLKNLSRWDSFFDKAAPLQEQQATQSNRSRYRP